MTMLTGNTLLKSIASGILAVTPSVVTTLLLDIWSPSQMDSEPK
ncbi:hypothetical protein N7931_01915 [Catenovulum sp. 2E275]|nr:hypothetical protein [Catenovulum sp. 2E275]MCU4674375.1 hypothetical protein [Catenovulum sp. 2E275]